MKKSRVILSIITVTLICWITACNKSKAKEEPMQASSDTMLTPTEEAISVSQTVEPTEEVKETTGFTTEKLIVLAEELTTQVIDGDCSKVNSLFIDDVRSTYTAEVLEKAYQDVISPIGSFVSILSSDTQEQDGVIYVGVLVQYEKRGLQVLYGFTQDVQLNTFRFNYVNLPTQADKVDNEDFYEIDIKVGATDLKMDGLMTVPKGVENPPVVILVQGSGQNDMDETIGAANNKPFADLAHGLAERGVASIRYNKRYYQYIDNVADDSTVEDEIIDDVGDAIRVALESGLIDSGRIYVVGHSQGGMMAPKIAQDHPELTGIIVLAGSPRHLEDIMYDQTVAALAREDDESGQLDKDSILEVMKKDIDTIKNLGDENLATPLLGISGYYWDSLNKIDIPDIVSKLTIPMLFLQGSEDQQVYASVDFMAWKEILDGHQNASFIEYEGLNHLFMPVEETTGSLDYDTENQVDVAVIEDIAKWIQSK